MHALLEVQESTYAHLQFLPPEGIKVFGSMLHTHILGESKINVRIHSYNVMIMIVCRPWTCSSTLKREQAMWSAGGIGTHRRKQEIRF